MGTAGGEGPAHVLFCITVINLKEFGEATTVNPPLSPKNTSVDVVDHDT